MKIQFSSVFRTTLAAVVVGLILPSAASAAPFSFTKIADTNSLIPNGTGTFEGLREGAVHDGQVAFFGFGSSGQLGVYKSSGGTLSRVADANTGIPGGSGNFSGFSVHVDIYGGTVAFQGNQGFGQAGIYTGNGGSLTKVVDRNTAIPDGSGDFSGFSTPVIENGKVAFRAFGSSSQEGIYTNAGGMLAKAADKNTSIPDGTGNFTSFINKPSIDGSTVVFRGKGSSSQEGIYSYSSGSLATIVDTNDAIPGGTGNFEITFLPVIDGGNVAFRGNGSGGQTGFYTSIGGTIALIADKNTAIPDGTGDFTGFDRYSYDSGNLAFEGQRSASGEDTQSGIYFWADGVLSKVIDITDLLDGKTLATGSSNLELQDGTSLDGSSILFLARFTDGSRGLYLAELGVEEAVPEPGTLAILGLGLAGLGFMRRRRGPGLRGWRRTRR